jgi:hypothetical protein
MKHKNEIVQTIYERMFRNEISYLVVGCAFFLVFEWLKVRMRIFFPSVDSSIKGNSIA